MKRVIFPIIAVLFTLPGLAIQRNNQNNYWEALGKVECPDL